MKSLKSSLNPFLCKKVKGTESARGIPYGYVARHADIDEGTRLCVTPVRHQAHLTNSELDDVGLEL
jgi:hypothetical protein